MIELLLTAAFAFVAFHVTKADSQRRQYENRYKSVAQLNAELHEREGYRIN